MLIRTAKTIGLATLIAATTLPVVPAAAQNRQDLARQVELLQQQLKALQEQLEALKTATAADREALAQETAAREATEKAAQEEALAAGGRMVFENGRRRVIPAENPKVVQSGTNRFSLSSADGAWTIAPTGRVHFDVGGYLSQKPEGTTGVGTPGNTLTGGVNVRRGRFGVTGKAMNDFTYTFILDAGGATDNDTLINTAQVSYTGISNTSIDFGYFSQYLTLEEATSSNDIVFMERASPVTIASSFAGGDPRFGFGIRRWAPRWWLGAYITGSRPGDPHALTQRAWNAYQRATYQVIADPLTTVHIGVNAAQTLKVPNSGPNTPRSLTFSERPELRIDPTNLLNTGAMGTAANPVKSAQVYGVEAAATFGSLYLQGEYFKYIVNRLARPRADFEGGYAQVSYTWGGRRTYSAASGSYGGVNPVEPFSVKGEGIGAFEVAGRISYVDLVDEFNSSIAPAAQPFLVNGGRQVNYTLGLNWFINSNMLMKVNYIHSSFNRATPAAGRGIAAGLDLDALAARVQFMF